MITTRTFGRILLGKPTLAQLGLTCVLASLWGFLPGLDVAPLSILIMVGLLLVLNANLALAALVAGLTRLLALLLMPLTFKLGVFLVEGPLGGLMSAMINGSGTALMGFDHYITSGSWVMGGLVGLVIAILFTRQVSKLRNMLSGLERDSEKYKSATEKGWTKGLARLLLGVDITKMEPRFEQKGGPIRVAGVVVVILAGATLVYATPLLERYFAKQMQVGLQAINGASVDVQSIELSFKDSRLTIEGLAMADPEKLTHDRFRASRVVMDLSVSDLLAKRVVLDLVEASGGAMDVQRDVMGKRVGPAPEEKTPIKLDMPDYEELEAYWEQAKVAKARLEKLKRLLEDLSGQLPESEEDQERSFEEWLASEIARKGYEYVRALHLLEGSPSFLLRHFKAHDVSNSLLAGETLNIDAFNLSTQPKMVGEAASFSINSSGKTFEFSLSLNESSAAASQSQIKLAYRGMAMERVTAQMKSSGDYLQGGTVDYSLKGAFRVSNGSYIELPLEARLQGVTLQLPKVPAVILNDFPVVALLKGPINNPRVKFDHKAFMDALRKRGFDAVIDSYKAQLKDEVSARVEKEKEKLVGDAKEKIGEKVGEKVGEQVGDKLGDQLGGQLGGLLGGKKSKEAAPEEGSTEPKEAESKPDVGSLLGGLLNKKKKPEEPVEKPPEQ